MPEGGRREAAENQKPAQDVSILAYVIPADTSRSARFSRHWMALLWKSLLATNVCSCVQPAALPDPPDLLRSQDGRPCAVSRLADHHRPSTATPYPHPHLKPIHEPYPIASIFPATTRGT